MALIQMDYMAESIQRWTTSWVYLPFDETDAKTEPGAVVLLHGYGGNHTDWLVHTTLCRTARALNLALVMPDGDNSFYLDHPARSEDYEAYIGQELPRLMQKAFSIAGNPENTFIMGVSMGAFGALRIGAKYGNVYRKAAGLSTPLAPFGKGRAGGHVDVLAGGPGGDSMLDALGRALSQKQAVAEMYVAVGAEDPLLADNRCLERFLLRNNVPHAYREVPGCRDAFEFLESESRKALLWMTSKEA